jgi:IclR family transcriptional regulator, acetate operon repressor
VPAGTFRGGRPGLSNTAERRHGNGHKEGSQTVAAVERAADVLLHFTRVPSPDLGVTEIATDLGIAKAAVHRVLASLRFHELVQLDEHTRRYSLGPAALSLGLAALSRVDVRKFALPELALLSQLTNETSTLSVRVGFERIYLDQITPPREVIMSVSIGVRYPLHAGASSKALLAFLDDAEIQRYLSGPLVSVTDSTLINRDELVAELAAIRERGWASSSGERQSGAASIAAPVLNHLGAPVAAISISGPKDRFNINSDEYPKFLLESTRRLSKKMGFQG